MTDGIYQKIEVLGLNGPKGSGKDTAAKGIASLLASADNGWTAHREGFADRLKLSAANALGYLTDDVDAAVAFCNSLKGKKDDGSDVIIQVARDCGVALDGTEYFTATQKITGRQYQQYYGTEAHRDVFGRDFWIDVVLPNRGALDLGRSDIPSETLFTIPDVRFDNEAEAVHDTMGQVWLIQRDAVESHDGHASEQPLRGELVDLVIDNNGDLRHLAEGLATALAKVYGFAPLPGGAFSEAQVLRAMGAMLT